MITFLIGYRDLLINRPQYTKEFFKMMDILIDDNPNLQCIVCDYGSQDGIREYLEDHHHKSKYISVEPNPNQWINLSKCFNAGIMHAKNKIITAFGIDFRFNQNLIDGVVKLFDIIGEMILRVLIAFLNKDGSIKSFGYTPYFLPRENIIMANGWDEKMFGWGKEEDDLIERIYRFQGLLEIRVRNFNVIHLWHDNSFSSQYDNKDLSKNHNALIMLQNIKDRGTNIKNSYWRYEK